MSDFSSICLIRYAKQPAKELNPIPFGILRMQVLYRLAPAFFSYRDIELGLCDIYEFIVCFRLDLGLPELLPQSLQLVLKCLYGLRLFISLNNR